MGRHFTTIRELIYWEYAKIISGKAVGDRHNYKFVNYTFHKLLNGKATPASILAENQQMFLSGETFAYCGAKEQLQWEHILPISLGGPDSIDNMVRACPRCNQAKGARDPYQWILGKNTIPRIVLGKFLKVIYEKYERENLLDSEDHMKIHDIGRITLSSTFSATSKTKI